MSKVYFDMDEERIFRIHCGKNIEQTIRYLHKGMEGLRLDESRQEIQDILQVYERLEGKLLKMSQEDFLEIKGTLFKTNGKNNGNTESSVSEKADTGNVGSGGTVTESTRDYSISGRPGKWSTLDQVFISGKHFFLMENQEFRSDAAYAIVDESGKTVISENRTGFDEQTKQRLEAYAGGVNGLYDKQKNRTQRLSAYQNLLTDLLAQSSDPAVKTIKEAAQKAELSNVNAGQKQNLTDEQMLKLLQNGKKAAVKEESERKSVLVRLYQKKNDSRAVTQPER